jgi:predicted RNA binding protein YcfA (HicA-like mRNA interferase family)
MVYADFSGQEIVKALRFAGYRPVSRKGSHVKLRKQTSQGTRNVSVPMSPADKISQDTYRSIADQCGANDFEKWVNWIDSNC